MKKAKIQDQVLGDLMTSMDDRRTGHYKKPILSIDITAGGEDDESMESMPDNEVEEGEDGGEGVDGVDRPASPDRGVDEEEGMDELPGPGGWDEYLKKRYGRK